MVFLDTSISSVINPAIWEQWSSSTPNTDHILFAEFNSTGSGVASAHRPSFATVLSASQTSAYTISSVLGSNYASWVDVSYL